MTTRPAEQIVLGDPVDAFARLERARILATAGRAADARRAYEDILAMWANGDAGVALLERARLDTRRSDNVVISFFDILAAVVFAVSGALNRVAQGNGRDGCCQHLPQTCGCSGHAYGGGRTARIIGSPS